MNDPIIASITDFIFVSHEIVPSDIIFVPGGVFASLAERAAELYRQGMAPVVMPAGKYSVKIGKFAGVKDKPGEYSGDYATECEFYVDVLTKKRSARLGDNVRGRVYAHARQRLFLAQAL